MCDSMFRALRHHVPIRRPSFASSALAAAAQVHPRADIDPALRNLLRDVDISLGSKKRTSRGPQPLLKKELVEVPGQISDVLESAIVDSNEIESFEDEPTMGRKSPAAEFGEYGLGAAVLPFELQKSIDLIISESDKKQLHNDAERLFHDTNSEFAQGGWEAAYDIQYRTKNQVHEHAERDGSAFASVALPAHFSVITAVLAHLKRRLEPEWRVERIIDWGAATGSGLWSSAYAFQEPHTPSSQRDVVNRTISNTTLRQYIGIDKREGLVTVGKRLLRDVDTGPLRVSWRKALRDDDIVPRSEGHYTVALSAFMLTSLPTNVARKALIKEMWSSGAHVLVIIDHNTKEGFEAIAQARDYVLTSGDKEFNDPEMDGWDIRGSHVVAPCPHDRPCPLYYPGDIKLVCGFSQRLQRPSFVRRTKHSGKGHEDMGYSYVVLRRGHRPANPDTHFGRVGRVGQSALGREQPPIKELFLHDETEPVPLEEEKQDSMSLEIADGQPSTPAAMDAALRLEAYHWPRLIFPPLKKSGHHILDACAPHGKVIRMTIPKSQGKQPFYDARKSEWGDLFPHPPKNPAQERYQPLRVNGKARPIRHPDIGKRGGKPAQKGVSYGALAEDLKAARKQSKRDRLARKQQWEQE
ncbi:3-methyl-2-oxobutanoate hydroxymethyltransferase [Mycena indigotica]|uniref:3-methyl-2-oxobutanoate hydroxymethyltransferase n=1 Tax=Mycena indigotica TaxID=2126181 RepID=A0A8H6WA59_9AGAR|nr:3-methyl-2-oxobutanoate hydroxymethyltransferase [Mycena indigotica]KAF7307293.1 3-methyl-2-oxobutanoate hydroxymethyltransferase [Mycena indigotica]